MLLGLDLGTGSVKAVLQSKAGAVLGEGSAPCSVESPRPGWAESSPDGWWDAAVRAVQEAVGRRGGEVEAIGLSGQMHGVVLGGRGRPPAAARGPLGRCPLRRRSPKATGDWKRTSGGGWQTRPRSEWPDRACSGSATTSPTFTAPPGGRCNPKTGSASGSPGKVFGEPSDASATLLYDLFSDDWSREFAQALGLRSNLLPPLVASGSAAGTLSREAAVELGLPADIPVAAGAADTAAAALGTGLLRPGTIQITVGTGAQILTPKDAPDPDPHARTHLYRSVVAPATDSGRFYTMAAVQNAGLALEWTLGVLGATWDDAYAEAFAVEPGAGGVTFLPYLSGERTPHFDPGARGAWTGLGLGTRPRPPSASRP